MSMYEGVRALIAREKELQLAKDRQVEIDSENEIYRDRRETLGGVTLTEAMEKGATSRFDKIEFEDESVYTGEVKDGIPSGLGVLVFSNGCEYAGEFLDGRRHGYGVSSDPKKGNFYGYFEHDKRQGLGLFTSSDQSATVVTEWNEGQQVRPSDNADEIVQEIVDEAIAARERARELINPAKKISFLPPALDLPTVGTEQEGGDEILTPETTRRSTAVVEDGVAEQMNLHNVKRITFGDGSVYEGQSANELPEGLGSAKYPDGSVFEGYWKEGVRHGYGVYRFSSGAMYEGAYDSDKRHGRGMYSFQTGRSLIVEWNRGARVDVEATPEIESEVAKIQEEAHVAKMLVRKLLKRKFGGESRAKTRRTSIAFINPATTPASFGAKAGEDKAEEFKFSGDADGLGCMTYPENSRYDGQWKAGKREGFGVFYFSSGARFVGEYKDDKRHGLGRYTYPNGKVIDGVWHEGTHTSETPSEKAVNRVVLLAQSAARMAHHQHGEGMKMFDDHIVTEEAALALLNPLKAFVSVKFGDGVVYHGESSDGKSPDGYGHVVYSDDSWYAGQFADGVRNGVGVFHFASGAVYAGEYEKDAKHGLGVYTTSDGVKHIAKFEENKNAEIEGDDLKEKAEAIAADAEEKAKLILEAVAHFRAATTKYSSVDGRRGASAAAAPSAARVGGETPAPFSVPEDKEVDAGELVLRKITYTNGSYYEGEVGSTSKNPHGHGVCTYADGSTYKGQWYDGIRSGVGVFEFSSGDKYEGNYRGDHKHGIGFYTTADGNSAIVESSYGNTVTIDDDDRIDEVVEAAKDAADEAITACEKVRAGVMGSPSASAGSTPRPALSKALSKAVLSAPKARAEVEPVVDPGVLELKTLEYSNGTVYEGNVGSKTGLPHGVGVCKYNDGGYYAGHWYNGKRSGLGVFKYASGDLYYGRYSGDQKVGVARYMTVAGEQMTIQTVGDTTEELLEHEGVGGIALAARYAAEEAEQAQAKVHALQSAGGDAAKGRTISRPVPLTRMLSHSTFEDGATYSGETDGNGVPDGYGVSKYPDQSKFEGFHKDGVREGSGVFAFASGAIYKGEYAKNRREGKGIYINKAGVRTARLWVEGKPTDTTLSDEEAQAAEEAAVEAQRRAVEKAAASTATSQVASADKDHHVELAPTVEEE
uniref:Uncharacterized protein n=1 Tax=Palpitomonas bilix TaxID=652834 RepID=A0A7S3DLJ3_9EUKA